MADEKEIESQDVEQSEQPSAVSAAEAETPAEPAVEGEAPAADSNKSQVSDSDSADAPSEEEPVADDKAAAAASDVAGEEDLAADGIKVVNEEDVPEGDAEAAMMAMLEDLPEESPQTSPEDIEFPEASAAKAEFQQLSAPAGQADTKNIDLLMDINLPISIELGRTKMSMADILGMGPGSVVELNKLAGEPVDVLVNYKIVAKGEVVVIDENFGVRITQLMTPEERLKLLGEEQ